MASYAGDTSIRSSAHLNLVEGSPFYAQTDIYKRSIRSPAASSNWLSTFVTLAEPPPKRPRGRQRIHIPSPAEESITADPTSRRKTQVGPALRAYRSQREHQLKGIRARLDDAVQTVREVHTVWEVFVDFAVDKGVAE